MFLQNSTFRNSAELVKYSLVQLPFSIITGEASLFLLKLGVIEAVSFSKKLLTPNFSSKEAQITHKDEPSSGILDFYNHHLKEVVVGGAIYYGALNISNISKVISLYKAYESIFGHSHPKLTGNFKAFYAIYDNAHTTAHVIDLLKTAVEITFGDNRPEDIKQNALEHFNEAFEFAYDYYYSLGSLISNDDSHANSTFSAHDEF